MAPFPPGKGGGQDVSYGYKGKGVTIHLLVEGGGMPLSAHTTGASGDERQQVLPLIDTVAVKSQPTGRPKKNPKEVHADKGYDANELRNSLRKRGIRPVISRRVWKNRKQPPGPKVASSKSRWQIERCFSWMQRKYRRLSVRWERRRHFFEGFLQIGIFMIWIDKIICG